MQRRRQRAFFTARSKNGSRGESSAREMESGMRDGALMML
jgi:hypothetical protein